MANTSPLSLSASIEQVVDDNGLLDAAVPQPDDMRIRARLIPFDQLNVMGPDALYPHLKVEPNVGITIALLTGLTSSGKPVILQCDDAGTLLTKLGQ